MMLEPCRSINAELMLKGRVLESEQRIFSGLAAVSNRFTAH